MITIEKFLGCCELEAAGSFLAWLGIILGSIWVVVFVIGAIAMPSVSCNTIIDYLRQNGHDFSFDDCGTAKTVLVVVFVVMVVLTLIGIFIDVLLLRGIKRRDHTLIRPMVIIVGIAAVVVVLSGLIQLSVQGFVSAIIAAIIYGYFFVFYYSLYVKIRDEKRGSAQYGRP